MACKPSYGGDGIRTSRCETSRRRGCRRSRRRRRKADQKTITFPGRFSFQSPPLPENRILGGPCGTARIVWKTIPQKHESPSEGPKNGIQGQKTASASSRIKDRRRRINSPDGRFRRESAEIRMRLRMHFRFSRAGRASMPTGSRAKAGFYRRPYAVLCTVCTSLKRKKTEKGPTPKRGA